MDEYIQFVEEWRKFYDTDHIKNKKVQKMKEYKKMINKDELLYKLKVVIEYLKMNCEYTYQVYNHSWLDMNKLNSNIVEYAKDVLYSVNLLLDNKNQGFK